MNIIKIIIMSVKSIDYSQYPDFDKVESNPKLTCWGDKSSIYSRLYCERDSPWDKWNPNKWIINLLPPPLYILCIVKLRKAGLNVKNSLIFKSNYPVLANELEYMNGIKIFHWIHGLHPTKHYIHVNNNGTRSDYSWNNFDTFMNI
jgi:hypothetical protein